MKARSLLPRSGILALSSIALAACSAVLGIPDVTEERPSEAADASPPAARDGTAPSSGDAAGTDGRALTDATDLGDAAPPDDARDGATPDDARDGATPVDAGDGAAPVARDASADGEAGAPCTTTVADPLNCGRCGHSCLGGACVAGTCQPVALVSELGRPFAIAVDDTSVYWTDRVGAQIAKVSKTQASPASIVVLAVGSSGGVISPTQIAVDGPYVYWLSSAYNGGIRRCAKTGCGGVGALVAAVDTATGLAFDESRAYFSDSSGAVSAVDKLADAGAVVEIAKNPGYARRLAVDATDVYWTDPYNAAVGRRVSRAPKTGLAAGLTPFAVATGQSNAYGIALAGGEVYWATNVSGGSIKRAPKTGIADGGVAEPIGISQPNPLNLAVTATHVYWVSQGTDVPFVDNGVTYFKHPHGSIARCDLPACAGGVQVLAREQDGAWDIAVDDTAVYWTVGGGDTLGSVMKIAQ